MLKDVVIAAAFTLVVGVAALESRSGDAISMLGALVAVAAGPVYLWRRKRQPIVPIAAIYCVVLLILVFWADFVIRFRQGRVEF